MPRSLNVALASGLGLAMSLLPALGHAQGTEEQQQACTPDALKLCSDTIPDIGKTTACMKSHYAQLSPRCQTAFHDATGDSKAPAKKTAAVQHTHVATRAERETGGSRAVERHATERRLPEREPVVRSNVTPRDAEPAVEPRRAEGYPPFPSPDSLSTRPMNARSQIASACRAGLIDSFTCSTTVPAFLGTTGDAPAE